MYKWIGSGHGLAIHSMFYSVTPMSDSRLRDSTALPLSQGASTATMHGGLACTAGSAC
jgi:hypothetical protein